MVVPKHIEAEVKHLFAAEHLTPHGIAQFLGIHGDTVNRILGLKGREVPAAPLRASKLDPYVPFLVEKLTLYPRIRSTRLYLMLVDKGYTGSVQHVRRRVRELRPRRRRAYLPITVFAGDEAQCDWAHFGTIKVGKAERRLSCFVMVLSYSRAMFACFTLDQSLESFLFCHVLTFHYFGGVPRIIRYDNLKAAVIDRYGSAVRYNDALLELAGHYCFKPSACNPYSGHEKGRVERRIRYIRDSYAMGRSYKNLDDANRQLSTWVRDVANQGPWPDDRDKRIDEVWAEEKQRLLTLPENDLSVTLQRPIRSGKTPLVRFDLNDYSIPYKLVGKPLTLVATWTEVRVCDGKDVVAAHPRTYSRSERIIDRAHFAGLYDEKPSGETVTARAYLVTLVPEVEALFTLMVEQGAPLGAATSRLIALVTEHGEARVRRAVRQANERGIARANYVAQVCRQLAAKKTAQPVLPIDLPENAAMKDLTIKVHDPSNYDALMRKTDNDANGKKGGGHE